MPRLIGIDYGKTRIGLSRSDPTATLASPWKVISLPKTDTLEKAKQVAPYLLDCEKAVIGLPLYLSGKPSAMTNEVKDFATHLQRLTHIPCVLWDERLTSKEVEKLMQSKQVNRKTRAAKSDVLSATLILQSYIDAEPPSQK